MGTRSLTHIHDDEGEILLTFYKQYDGYPEGHGKLLAEFLSGFKIVNGFSGNEGAKGANGMGCLAAQVLAEFKSPSRVEGKGSIGNVYIYKAGSSDCGEEYVLPDQARGRAENAGRSGRVGEGVLGARAHLRGT